MPSQRNVEEREAITVLRKTLARNVGVLRDAAGLKTAVYPEPKRLGQQLRYADQHGFQLAVVAGETEIEGNCCQLKDLNSGGSQEISLENEAADLITQIKQQLGVQALAIANAGPQSILSLFG